MNYNHSSSHRQYRVNEYTPNSRTPINNRVGASSYTISTHAKRRFSERVSINSISEMQKFAAAAKNNGIRIETLNSSNYAQRGLTLDEMHYLLNTRQPNCHNTYERYYYHYNNKGYIVCYEGHKSRTVKTIFESNLNIGKCKEGRVVSRPELTTVAAK